MQLPGQSDTTLKLVVILRQTTVKQSYSWFRTLTIYSHVYTCIRLSLAQPQSQPKLSVTPSLAQYSLSVFNGSQTLLYYVQMLTTHKENTDNLVQGQVRGQVVTGQVPLHSLYIQGSVFSYCVFMGIVSHYSPVYSRYIGYSSLGPEGDWLHNNCSVHGPIYSPESTSPVLRKYYNNSGNKNFRCVDMLNLI